MANNSEPVHRVPQVDTHSFDDPQNCSQLVPCGPSSVDGSGYPPPLPPPLMPTCNEALVPGVALQMNSAHVHQLLLRELHTLQNKLNPNYHFNLLRMETCIRQLSQSHANQQAQDSASRLSPVPEIIDDEEQQPRRSLFSSGSSVPDEEGSPPPPWWPTSSAPASSSSSVPPPPRQHSLPSPAGLHIPTPDFHLLNQALYPSSSSSSSPSPSSVPSFRDQSPSSSTGRDEASLAPPSPSPLQSYNALQLWDEPSSSECPAHPPPSNSPTLFEVLSTAARNANR